MTGILVTAILVTGILVTAILVTAILVTGILVTGILVTGILVTGILVTGIVQIIVRVSSIINNSRFICLINLLKYGEKIFTASKVFKFLVGVLKIRGGSIRKI